MHKSNLFASSSEIEKERDRDRERERERERDRERQRASEYGCRVVPVGKEETGLEGPGGASPTDIRISARTFSPTLSEFRPAGHSVPVRHRRRGKRQGRQAGPGPPGRVSVPARCPATRRHRGLLTRRGTRTHNCFIECSIAFNEAWLPPYTAMHTHTQRLH